MNAGLLGRALGLSVIVLLPVKDEMFKTDPDGYARVLVRRAYEGAPGGWPLL